MVAKALKAAEVLEKDGINAMENIHTLKPIDEEIILKAAECGAIQPVKSTVLLVASEVP